jgi:two-component system, NarL family, sensor histidine kinase LiaS
MMAMMNDHATPLRNNQLLDLTVYVTVIAMVSIGFTLLPDRLTRLAATAVCLAFGLVHRFGFRAANTRRRIIMYLSVQTVLVTALLAVTQTSDPFTFPFFLLGVQAMLVLPQRSAVLWIALFYVIGSISVLWSRGAPGLVNLLLNAAAFFFVGAFAYTLRQAEQIRREKEQLVDELQASQRRVQDLAVAAERNRLARDLHDSAKQQAFALSAQLDAVHSFILRDPHAAERHLDQAEQLADSLRQELATLILELRPSAFGDAGLATALRQYAADWSRQSAIVVVVHVHGERVLPREIEETLFRIAQEALANVARHSRAHTTDLQLDYTADRVTLTIQDDGQGFEPQQITAGVGTHSMRERAATLPHGALTLDTAQGRGTRVIVQCHI